MFASSLSSAARQPKGRGYSRKQRDIENRLGYRGRPASPKKFRRISQRTQRFLPPSLSPSLASKARECLQSPVVSIRRRLPPTGHVRFTSRAGKCIGMLAFFFLSLLLLLLFLLLSPFDSARGNCWPRRNTPCQSHSRRRQRRKRWLCWARDEIDRRCETRGERERRNVYRSRAHTRNGSGKNFRPIPGTWPNADQIPIWMRIGGRTNRES